MHGDRIDAIHGACLFTLDRHGDDRGYFQELYSIDRPDYYHWTDCRQINLSKSKICTLRGIHIAPYQKIVSCIKGKIYDVIVDMRPHSPTYGNWYGVWLSDKEPHQLFVPANCGHAFYAAEQDTQVVYFQGDTYKPGLERSIHFKSPAFNITWPGSGYYRLSERDREAERLERLPQPEPFEDEVPDTGKPTWWKRLKAAIRS